LDRRQMEIDDERVLLEGLAGMNDHAWRAFVRQYWRPLYAFVGSRFECDESTREEIVQMTFVRCVKSIRTFDPARGNLLGWLKAVAANEGHTLARRRPRESALSALPDGLADAVTAAIDREPLPEDVAARSDVALAIEDALSSLKPAYHTAIAMKYMEGRPVAEIARYLNLSEKAAESVLARARAALREALSRRLRGELPEILQ